MFAALHWRAAETKIDPVGPARPTGFFVFLAFLTITMNSTGHCREIGNPRTLIGERVHDPVA